MGFREIAARFRDNLAAATRSWFELTNKEQAAVLLVLSLFLLGTAVRFFAR